MDDAKKLDLKEFLETYWKDCASSDSLAHCILELMYLGKNITVPFTHIPTLLIYDLSFCDELKESGITFCSQKLILNENKVIQEYLVNYDSSFKAKDFTNQILPAKLKVEFFLKGISVNDQQTDLLFPYEVSFSLFAFRNKFIKDSKIESIITRDLSEKLRVFLPNIKCSTLCVGF